MIGDQVILLMAGTALLFAGVGSIALSRNLIKTMMSFQVVLFGANLALFSSGLGGSGRLTSDVFVLLSLVVGAAVEGVGLAIILKVGRKYGTLDPSKLRKLRD